jgi:hypothetical protein
MLLEFSKTHWLTLYRDRLPDGAAPLQMRVMTRDRRSELSPPATFHVIAGAEKVAMENANNPGGSLSGRGGNRWIWSSFSRRCI